jgi:hypothetical protein
MLLPRLRISVIRDGRTSALDITAVDVAEIQALRQEITTRVTLASAVVTLELTALVAGLALVDKLTHVLVALAAVSSFLWLQWLDQSTQIQKIAAYLGAELAPRMTLLAGRAVFGWESYLGQLNNRELSVRTLHGDHSRPNLTGIVRPWRADWYSPLLFGVAPPALPAFYIGKNLQQTATPAPLWVGAVVIAAALWIFSISRFFDFVRNAAAVDKAILATAVCGPVSR